MRILDWIQNQFSNWLNTQGYDSTSDRDIPPLPGSYPPETENNSDNDSDEELFPSDNNDDDNDPIDFRLIEDPYFKRISEANAQDSLVRDFKAIIPITYLPSYDIEAFHEAIADKVTAIFTHELHRYGGLKIKIVLFAEMKKPNYNSHNGISWTYARMAFKHEALELLIDWKAGDITEKGFNEIKDQIERMENLSGSNWTFVRVEEVVLEINAYTPLRGSTYIPLPKQLSNAKTGLINPQNVDDNECFNWCIAAYHYIQEAHKQNKKPDHPSQLRRIKKYRNKVDYTGINFPLTLKDISKFEKNNPEYAISIFTYFLPKDKAYEIRPLQPSSRVYDDDVKYAIDLLLVTDNNDTLTDRKNKNDIPDGINTHYVLIGHWDRLMRTWNKHHGTKYFCRKCLCSPFSTKDILLEHIAKCKKNEPQLVSLPKQGKHIVQFKNFNRMLKKPYVAYADLEALMRFLQAYLNKNNNTEKLCEQIACSYAYSLIRSDGKMENIELSRSENPIENFIMSLDEQMTIIREKLEDPVPLEMTNATWSKYHRTKTCWICKKPCAEAKFNKVCVVDSSTNKYIGAAHRMCHAKKPIISYGKLEAEDKIKHDSYNNCLYCKSRLHSTGDNRVIDHDHITGKYRGVAHSSCNLQLRIKPDEIKIPVVFHYGRGYDFHHILQEIAKITDEPIDIIPNNQEKYITFSIGQLQFIDSTQFSLPSLEQMANNLRDNKESPKGIAKRFPHLASQFPHEWLPMIARKGFFCYKYIDSYLRFKERYLPCRKAFNDDLNGLNYCAHDCSQCIHYCKKSDHKKCKHCMHDCKSCGEEKIFTISQKDYMHAQAVWDLTGCKTLGDYHDLYLKTDVLILTDAFEYFRQSSYDAFELDPANYLTAPGLAWDAALKKTGVQIEAFHEEQEDMLLFIEAAKRGGMCMARRRFARANIDEVKGYIAKKARKWLLYLDANNLYGWAMSQYLPIGNYKWIDIKHLNTVTLQAKLQKIKANAKCGSIWEVKLSVPEHLHSKFRDFPLCPETIEVPRDWMSGLQEQYIEQHYKGKYTPIKKLITTQKDKDHYILHYRNLQQCLQEGYVLEKVYKVLEFDQSPWLEPYIRENTQRRQKAKNAFEKDFWKLMNNSVFGKTMEDVRRRQRIDLVRVVGEEKRLRKMLSDPAFIGRKIFYDANLVAVHRKQTKVYMNKPVIVGVTILDLAKYFMYDYWYGHLKMMYGDRVKLLYTDTDSLIISVETDDVYEDMIKNKELYDFSNYPKDHRVRIAIGEEFIERNKAVIGKMKDESGGRYGEEYAGVRSKAYSFYKWSYRSGFFLL